MKKLLLALGATLALSACSLSTKSAIATYSAKGVITADAAYIAASRAGQVAVVAGLLDKSSFKRLDADAFNALWNLQQAQRVGVALDVFQATTAFNSSLKALYAAAGQ